MNFTKIPTKKISESVVEQIEEWILAGDKLPGDKLPSVRELCERFQVGRSAVRDAITILKGKGIVEVRQGEGAFICKVQTRKIFEDLLFLSSSDIYELYSVRKMLEISTAEMAALKRRETDLTDLEQALQEMKAGEQLESWQADLNFHMAIAQATGNKIIVQLMQTISTMMKKALIEVHKIIFTDTSINLKIYQQHLAIFEAIKACHPQKARESMLLHLQDVEQLLLRSLKEHEGRNENDNRLLEKHTSSGTNTSNRSG